MRNKKTRQHHVWEHLLNAWSNSGKVWCRQDGRLFPASPGNLAVESKYYRLRRLDERDKEVVRWLCVENRAPEAAEMAERMLAMLDRPYDVLGELSAMYPKIDFTEAIDTLEINYIEDFFAAIESKMVPILKKLRAGDVSSATCAAESPWLAFYLSSQYFRTKSMQERISSFVADPKQPKLDCDWSRVWIAMRIIMSCQVGAGLYERLDRAAWTIMESPTDIEFITSDQPLFNTRAHERTPDGFVKEFVLYFPVTPRLALLCDATAGTGVIRSEYLPEGNARFFNQRMAAESLRQVFARRRHELEGIK